MRARAASPQGAARALLLLAASALLALVAMDRAVVLWPAHWAWAAREIPPLTLDPYRVEALLRTTPPDRRNVVILGNSIAEAGLDGAALEQRFASAGLRFPKITLGGSPAVTFGMIADAVLALEPRAVVYVASPPALRSRGYLDHVHTYDVFAVPALFTPAELLAEPRFHLDGVVGQANVFARHRAALRRALAVRLGYDSWERRRREAERARLRHMMEGGDALQEWARDRAPEVYPNPNSRALGLLARRLREHGARLVVLDPPLHPMAAMLVSPRRVTAYRETLRELAAQDGFELIPAEALPPLAEADFADWVHANARGRERLTAALADALARSQAAGG
jgi:hypothetical protein